jgi:hypothetical protein
LSQEAPRLTKKRTTLRKLLTFYHPRTRHERGILWATTVVITLVLIAQLVFSFIWGRSPSLFEVQDAIHDVAKEGQNTTVTGYATTATLIKVADTLLYKPGGYLSNDVMPPGVFMDNMQNWEFGVLTQVRDLARALRNDMSRSQSQSVEDADLAIADPQFNFSNDSWMFPATESEYKKGIQALTRYLNRLSDPTQQNAQFYARADNLRDWLAIVEKRLGSLSQRLSASVGQVRFNIDLAGETGAQQSTPSPKEIVVKTPWLKIDDVFYEARGATWALILFLRAVEIDFADVLQKKNALVSLRQITRELESTQATVWSPVVLNGTGFGFVSNYSLIMASYVSRANAAVIDLRNLLAQG